MMAEKEFIAPVTDRTVQGLTRIRSSAAAPGC